MVKRLFTILAFLIILPSFVSAGIQDGLVSWWTMDYRDLARNVLDRSWNGNNGYMSGFTSTSSAVVAGKLGQGLKFDGVNDYVKGSTNSILNPSSAITIAFWIKVTQAPPNNNSSLIEKGGNASWRIRCGAISPCAPQIIYNGAFGANGANLTLHNWAHVVVVADGTGSFIYTNSVAGTKDNDAYTGASSVDSLCINGTGTSCLIPNTGMMMDDVRVYSRALSAAEVRQLWRMGLSKH